MLILAAEKPTLDKRCIKFTVSANASAFLRLHEGSTRYGPVDYKGTLYVKGNEGSDYLGMVFGYQSNRKFYVAMWRKENSNFEDLNTRAGIKGVQLKVGSTQNL